MRLLITLAFICLLSSVNAQEKFYQYFPLYESYNAKTMKYEPVAKGLMVYLEDSLISFVDTVRNIGYGVVITNRKDVMGSIMIKGYNKNSKEKCLVDIKNKEKSTVIECDFGEGNKMRLTKMKEK